MSIIYPTREAIFTALYALLTPLSPDTFKTVTRRMIMPANVTSQITPMLVLRELDETATYGRPGADILPVTEYNADLVIYFINPEKDEMNPSDPYLTAGSTILNPLIDAVHNALAPDDLSSGRLRLRTSNEPLVAWCRIEGQTIYETGDTDPEGLGGAQIPVKIMVGNG